MPLGTKFRDRFQRQREELSAFVPRKIIDFHVHMGLPEHAEPATLKRKKTRMAIGFPQHSSVRALDLMYNKLLNIKNSKTRKIVFSFPFKETRIAQANKYILSNARKNKTLVPFLLGDVQNPQETVDLINKTNKSKKVIKGIKVYDDQVLNKARQDIRISDFVKPELMQSLNAHGMVLMLHLPAMGFRTPENITQLRELAQQYPDAKIVLAHMGRALDPIAMKEGISAIKDLKNVYLETSTSTEPAVMQVALEGLGPKRILFGSDAPYAFMGGKFELQAPNKRAQVVTLEKYPWSTKKSRQILNKKKNENKVDYTINVYHTLDAIKKAAEKLNLSEADIRNIFYRNAERLLK